jgi:C1q domain
MKIHIEFELPRWAKLTFFALACGALVSVANAAPPKTFIAGETLTAQALNDNFSGLDQRLGPLESAAHPASAFRAERSTALVVAPSGAVPIPFNNVVFDVAGEYAPATGLFTATSAVIYLAICSVDYPNVGNFEISALLMKNGTVFEGADMNATNTGSFVRPQASALVQLTAGDTVGCAAYQNSAGNQSINPGSYTNFSVARLY